MICLFFVVVRGQHFGGLAWLGCYVECVKSRALNLVPNEYTDAQRDSLHDANGTDAS
jgi:hypothetical protein